MSTPIEPSDSVSQRITKLLPADVTAALIAIKSSLPSTGLDDAWVVYGAIIIGLISPFYFFFVLKTQNTLHIVFLVASFIVFAVALNPIEIGNFVPDYRTLVNGANVILTPVWLFLVTPIVASVLGKDLTG